MWSSKKIVLSPSKSENGAILETSCFFKSKNFDRIWTFSNKSSHLLEFFVIGYNKEDDLLVFPLCLTVEHFQTWVNNNIFCKIIPKQYVNIHTSTTFDAKLPDFVYGKAFINIEWMLTQTSYLSLISLILLVEKKLSCGKISAFHVWQLWGNWNFLHMWRNFRFLHMTDVEKSEILLIWHVCDVENVAI